MYYVWACVYVSSLITFSTTHVFTCVYGTPFNLAYFFHAAFLGFLFTSQRVNYTNVNPYDLQTITDFRYVALNVRSGIERYHYVKIFQIQTSIQI